MRKEFAQDGTLMREIDDSGKVIRYSDSSGMLKIPATELCELCLRHGSDKCGNGYTQFYDYYFSSIRSEVRKVLEIGVSGGCSIKMWHDYFPQAIIYGIDKHPSNGTGIQESKAVELSNARTVIKFADQSKEDELIGLDVGKDFDIICDDGSHMQRDQQLSFAILFPLLKTGSFYICEDICSVNGLCNETINWGQADRINGTDTTAMFFDNIDKQIFKSQYISPERLQYLKENIDWIKFHFGMSSGQPNANPYEWGGPITVLIKKK
jgi:hypothetical protein